MRFNILGNLFYDELLFAVILVVGGFILGKIVYFLFHSIFTALAKKTETDLDDRIIEALKAPIPVVIMAVALFYGLFNLTALNPYDVWIRGSAWAVLALLAVWTVTRLINAVLDWYSASIADRTETDLDNRIFPILKTIINIALYVLLLLMILGHFNIEITPLIASLGVASLAVALALQDTLSNFFAGVFIMADKPVKVGDYILMDNGEEGHVDHIGWRSSRIKKLSNNYVILPNSKLANAVITNYDLPSKPLSVITLCGVAYDSDLDKVEKVAYQAAVKTRDSFEGAYHEFDPLIRFYEFGDSNINFKVIIRAKTYTDRYELQHQLIKGLKKAFDKNGIEISWPVRKVYYGKGKP